MRWSLVQICQRSFGRNLKLSCKSWSQCLSRYVVWTWSSMLCRGSTCPPLLGAGIQRVMGWQIQCARRPQRDQRHCGQEQEAAIAVVVHVAAEDQALPGRLLRLLHRRGGGLLRMRAPPANTNYGVTKRRFVCTGDGGKSQASHPSRRASVLAAVQAVSVVTGPRCYVSGWCSFNWHACPALRHWKASTATSMLRQQLPQHGARLRLDSSICKSSRRRRDQREHLVTSPSAGWLAASSTAASLLDNRTSCCRISVNAPGRPTVPPQPPQPSSLL